MSAQQAEVPPTSAPPRPDRPDRAHRRPHRHHHILGRTHTGGPQQVEEAIAAAAAAAPRLGRPCPGEQRAAVFIKPRLLAGPWRMRFNAATMLGQSKTCYQLEIDAACEFQPTSGAGTSISSAGFGERAAHEPAQNWNQVDLRPLEVRLRRDAL